MDHQVERGSEMTRHSGWRQSLLERAMWRCLGLRGNVDRCGTAVLAVGTDSECCLHL